MKFVHTIDKHYQIAAGNPYDREDVVTFECTAVGYDGLTTRHWSFVGTNEIQAMESSRDVYKAALKEYPYLIFIHDTTKST